MKIFTKLTFVAFFFLLGKNPTALAQTQVQWSNLADVKFEKKFSTDLGYDLYYATFGKSIKKLEGKEVSVRGYMIPMDALGVYYVLSKNPNSSCFFCGGGGPETVVELEVKPSAIRRYEVDEMKTFKGILKLNKVNDKQLTYVLTEAEPK